MSSAAPPNLSILTSELRGKTVRVMTKNGFSMRGRVVQFDQDHMNIVLDCIDAACGIIPARAPTAAVPLGTPATAAENPPHIGPWHREVFVRGSSIRWLEVDSNSVGL